MKLRSLDHIRYLDAAARTLSFRDAAQVLNVTPAAVSQRIRQIEHELGVSLFERHVRRVDLTDEGRFLALEAARALEIVDRAISSVVQHQDARSVTLSTTPTFAEQLLLPLLAGLHERVADRSVRVMVSTDLVDLAAMASILQYARARSLPWLQGPEALLMPLCTRLFSDAGQRLQISASSSC